MMVVASLVPNFLMGIITGAGIIVSACLPLTSCDLFFILMSTTRFKHAIVVIIVIIGCLLRVSS